MGNGAFRDHDMAGVRRTRHAWKSFEMGPFAGGRRARRPRHAGTAEEGQFYGLMRERDLTPFGFMRLDMRPAHAVSTEPGSWAVETDIAFQNTWALSPEVEKYLTGLEADRTPRTRAGGSAGHPRSAGRELSGRSRGRGLRRRRCTTSSRRTGVATWWRAACRFAADSWTAPSRSSTTPSASVPSAGRRWRATASTPSSI